MLLFSKFRARVHAPYSHHWKIYSRKTWVLYLKINEVQILGFQVFLSVVQFIIQIRFYFILNRDFRVLTSAGGAYSAPRCQGLSPLNR